MLTGRAAGTARLVARRLPTNGLCCAEAAAAAGAAGSADGDAVFPASTEASAGAEGAKGAAAAAAAAASCGTPDCTGDTAGAAYLTGVAGGFGQAWPWWLHHWVFTIDHEEWQVPKPRSQLWWRAVAGTGSALQPPGEDTAPGSGALAALQPPETTTGQPLPL